MPHESRGSVCLSVVALFLAGCAEQGSKTRPPAAAHVKCFGINGCSGQGQCAMRAPDGGQLNACGGQNTCAGKGWIEVEEAACAAKGGRVLAVVDTTIDTCAADPGVPRLGASDAEREYNLRDRLAMRGYDPITYFPEGGGTPRAGLAEITHEHEGVLYRFATEDNRERFKADTTRYEPAFGGWCAYAMGKTGRKVDVDPEAFIIDDDGRLLLFYRTRAADTRVKWRQEPEVLRPRAEHAWSKRTGECRGEAES